MFNITTGPGLQGQTYHSVTYDFGGVSVPAGSIITFNHTIHAGSGMHMNLVVGPESCLGFTVTYGVTPPLDDDFMGLDFTASVTGSLTCEYLIDPRDGLDPRKIFPGEGNICPQ